jgi:acyl-CoA dehydrogenase
MAFGVPPIVKYGSPELQGRFLPELLTGAKRTCIAITEPEAGSDVANITTTAVKTPDGKHYIVNGTKKWITNGIWSDYSSMAVRTGGPGPGGLSMLVVPLKGNPGVNMRRLKVGGQVSAGTTFIELDDVKVPVENLIGEEGMGMRYIMTNFNHERLTIAIGATRQARVALGAAMEYVLKREAFGKPLIDQPVVRHRLAKAGALLESQWAWVEQFVYQMTKLPKATADIELGGLTAMVKAQSGIVLNECAQTAQLLFGGNGYTKSGQGELVERKCFYVITAECTNRFLQVYIARYRAFASLEDQKTSCLTWAYDNLSKTSRTRPKPWSDHKARRSCSRHSYRVLSRIVSKDCCLVPLAPGDASL